MPSIEEWNRQIDQLNWMAQHGMEGLGPLVNELPAWAQGRVRLPGGAGAGIGGAGGGPGVLQGAPPTGYNPASGGIPGVTDPSVSLANLISGIGGQLGNLAPIIRGATGAESQALRDQYPAQFFDALGQVGTNITNRARGDIQDLLPQLTQGAAEWGIGSGVGTNSPAFSSKLTRDVLGSAYNVQEQAARDLAQYKNTVPTVAPYGAERLLPNIANQLALQQLADTLRAAPVPEAAFQRNLALANQGLGRGFGAGSFGGIAQSFGANRPAQNQFPMFVPQGGPGAPVAAAPAGPGWGFAGNNQGGFAAGGNVPLDELNRAGFGGAGLVGPDWDRFFDLSIDEPFMGNDFFDVEEEFGGLI